MNGTSDSSPNSVPAFPLSNLFLQLFLLHLRVFRNLLFPTHDNEPLLLLLGRVNFSLTTSNRFSLIHKALCFFPSRSYCRFFFFLQFFHFPIPRAKLRPDAGADRELFPAARVENPRPTRINPEPREEKKSSPRFKEKPREISRNSLK